MGSVGAGTPWPLYIVEGREGSRTQVSGASLPPVTPPPPGLRLVKPCRDPATSTITPSCCWISINLSFPCWIKKEETSLPTVRVLNAEVPSVRRSVIGDLDHDEYDSINPVLLNASARDLLGYVDALLSLSLLDDSID